MTDKLLETMGEVYQKPAPLPKNVSEYELLSCLKHGDGSAVYLLRKDGERFILKNARGDRAASLKNEYETLSRGGFAFLPTAYDFWTDNDGAWLLREYIDGAILSSLAEKPLDEPTTAALLINLCDILSALHNSVPPIIHRDIKPQNIVRKPDGTLAIIDVGTAREFDHAAENDTFYMGTAATAAPEQYGFAQTDARTDIYAVGKLAAFLLCGDCSRNAARLPASSGLKRVIAKCLAFDPKNRYQTAAALKSTIKRVMFAHSRVFRGLMVAVLCAALFVSGFAVGEFAPPLLPQRAAVDAPVAFKEPLIERAVRLSLGKDKREPLYAADMANVTELCVIGVAVFPTDDAGQAQKPLLWGVNHSDQYRGDIESLVDLEQCVNLRKLALIGQRITDISPLSGLPIERLDLAENPDLSDFTPLMDCSELYQLTASSTALSDLSFASGITSLRQLQIGNLPNLTTLEPLRGLRLNDIVTLDTPAFDFDVFLDMPLMAVDLWRLTQADLERLCAIESITGLSIWGSGGAVTDLSALERLPNLEYLRVIDTEIADLAPLLRLPALKELTVSAELAREIMEIAPRLPFEVVIN